MGRGGFEPPALTLKHINVKIFLIMLFLTIWDVPGVLFPPL